MIPGIAAKKGAEAATKPLTGDIYVRRWTSERGKGKNKKVVEHEVRVNALTGAIAAVGVGLTAVAGGVALWMAQQKLTKTTNKMLIRRVRVYGAYERYISVPAWTEYVNDQWVEPQTVYDAPIGVHCLTDGATIMFAQAPPGSEGLGRWMASHKGHTLETIRGSATFPGYWTTKLVEHPAEYSYRQAADGSKARTVIMTARGVPVKTYAGVRVMPADILGPANVDYWGFNKMLVEQQTKEDRTGIYDEWVVQYISTTGKKNLGLSDREGFKVGL